jgi:ABC-type protease/lipase transport system fused ATPase/permease subunit
MLEIYDRVLPSRANPTLVRASQEIVLGLYYAPRFQGGSSF